MLIAVNYHYVRPSFDAPYPSIFGVTPEELGRQLDTLAEAGTFVGAEDIIAALQGEQALPDRSWIVTFDDGLREQFEHALPVLEDRGIAAIFFVNTAPIQEHELSTVHKIHLTRAHVPPEELTEDLQRRDFGDPDEVDTEAATQQYTYDRPAVARLKYFLNMELGRKERDRLVNEWFDALLAWDEGETARDLYMDRDQIADLADRDLLGTHGHRHVPLGKLPEAAQVRQIRTSRKLLEGWTGRPVRALSYPFGGREAVTPATRRAAIEAGIEFAFTMERAGNTDLRQPRLLARCACNDLPGGSDPRWPLDAVFERIPAASWYREDRP